MSRTYRLYITSINNTNPFYKNINRPVVKSQNDVSFHSNDFRNLPGLLQKLTLSQVQHTTDPVPTNVTPNSKTTTASFDGGTFPSLKLGGNLNITENVFEQAKEIGASSMQLFVSEHKSWPPKIIDDETIQRFNRLRILYNFDFSNIVVHCNLLINVASPDDVNYQIAINTVKKELQCCLKMGIKYYVLHPGSGKTKLTKEKAIHRMANCIRLCLEDVKGVTILFENMAGQGNVLGSTFEDLKKIIDSVNMPAFTGICLDTQHLWAAGYNITEWKDVREEFDNIIGLQNLRLLHLNDSMSNFNSKSDHHAKIGAGRIPMTTLKKILEDEALHNIPIIIESSNSQSPDNLAILSAEIKVVQTELQELTNQNSNLHAYNDYQRESFESYKGSWLRNSTPRLNLNSKRPRPEEDLSHNHPQEYQPTNSIEENKWNNEHLIYHHRTITKDVKGSMYLFNSMSASLKGSRNHRWYLNAIVKKESAMKRLGDKMKSRWKLLKINRKGPLVDNGERDRTLNRLDGLLKSERKSSRKTIEDNLRMEYYTPRWLTAHIHRFWEKGIDLDPTSSWTANEVIQAKHFFTKEDGDFTVETDWKADTLYMNPPFDKISGERFVTKFGIEWDKGNIGEALILIPATGGQWLEPLMSKASNILIPRKRLTFWNKEAKGLSPRYSTYLLYFGRRSEVAKSIFEQDFHFLNNTPMAGESIGNLCNLATSAKSMLYKDDEGYVSFEEDDPEEEEQYWETISAQVKSNIQGTDVIAIMDSGACNTTISMNLWLKIQQRRRMKLRRWRWGGIKVANDGTVFPIGWTNMNIKVGPSEINIPVSVQKNLPVDALLGTDWLRETKSIVDWEDEELKFKGLPGVTRIKTTLQRSRLNKLPAFLKESVIIKAREQRLCAIESGQTDIRSDLNYYISPLEKFADRGVLIAPGYTKLENNTCLVMIGNPSDEAIRISQGKLVAELIPSPSMEDSQFLETKAPESQDIVDNQTEEEIILEVENLVKTIKIDREKFTAAEFKSILQLLTKHRKVFSDQPGLCHLIQHTIDTGNHEPIICQPYREPYMIRPIVKDIIKEMLDNKLIRPSSSPWAFPVVMVPKPDGKWRFTVDYRKLNGIVPRDAFPLPRVDDHLSSLGDSKWFTVFDLVSGFWQIGMREEDKEKTAFICSEGLYEYERMPMGLSNSPATFQRLMQRVIPADIRMLYALVYLDDIIVHSKTLEEHLQHIDEVLTRVGKANLKIKPKKVAFARSEVKYLGHLVTADGTKPDPGRVEAISKWKTPESTKELRSFVQLVNYYRQYIPNFAKTAAPLYNLMKKDTEFSMGPLEVESFNHLKTALTGEAILKRPNWDRPFILQTDASIKGLGAVLAQRDENDKEYVIGYASRTLSADEKIWGSHEWEALALIWGAEYFRPYLYGQRFTVESDNLDLTWLRDTKKSGRLLRWGLRLSEFDFRIIHKKGTLNGNADALSRHPLDENRHHEPERCKQMATARFHEDIPGIADSTQYLGQHSPTQVSGFLEEWINSQKQCTELGIIIKLLKGELIEPPNSKSLERRNWEKLKRKARHFYLRDDGILANRCILQTGTRGLQDYESVAVPVKKREAILTSFHGKAHIGINKAYRWIRERYFWNDLRKDLKNFIKGCHLCRSRKDPKPGSIGLLSPFLHLNNRPFDTVTMDLYGELPTSKEGYKYILVIVDHFTKWPEAIPLKSKTAEEIADAINKELIAKHSVPRKVVSDNDGPLIEKGLNLMWKLYGSHRVTSSVQNPQTNTAAERFNQFLGNCIYAAVDSKQVTWPDTLSTILMAYRMTVNPTTGESPYFLLHGTDPVLPNDILFAVDSANETEIMSATDYATRKFAYMRKVFGATREKLDEFARKEKLRSDENRTKPDNITIGKRVMVYHHESHAKGESTKMASRYSGPYRVLREVEKDKTYHLWHPQTGKDWIVNVNKIRPFDLWENYQLNRAERDDDFWESWVQSAVKGPSDTITDTDTHWSPDDGHISYAQDWSGEWIPFDNRSSNFEIIRILDRKEIEGEWRWLVQWKGNWLPTWEPLEIFEEAKTTGTGLVWLEFENNHPYPGGTKQPTIKNIRRRKR